MSEADPLLEIRGLTARIGAPGQSVTVVDSATFTIPRRQSVGIVGESGSGKTMMSRALMNLLPGSSHIESDLICFDGQLLDPAHPPHEHFWGPEIAMVFQDPATALNPVRTLGAHLSDPLRRHKGMSKKQARSAAIELLGHVGIPDPGRRVDQYPHELSGGMRQRVMIAIAISCEPKLLIADEPTTGLDVTVQRQILGLLRRLKEELGMSMMLISHDLALLTEEVDVVNVMYAGRIVETIGIEQLRGHRMHHRYTQALMQAHPDINAPVGQRLEGIAGAPPALTSLPEGCYYADRCDFATRQCREIVPPTSDDNVGGSFACHHPLYELETVGAAAR